MFIDHLHLLFSELYKQYFSIFWGFWNLVSHRIPWDLAFIDHAFLTNICWFASGMRD